MDALAVQAGRVALAVPRLGGLGAAAIDGRGLEVPQCRSSCRRCQRSRLSIHGGRRLRGWSPVAIDTQERVCDGFKRSRMKA